MLANLVFGFLVHCTLHAQHLTLHNINARFNFQFPISDFSMVNPGGGVTFLSPFFFKFFSLFENLASSDGWAGLTHLLLFYFLFMRNGKGELLR